MAHPSIEAMELIAGKNGRIAFQLFPDRQEHRQDERVRRTLTAIKIGELYQLGPWLRQMNNKGAGVFHTVNGTDGRGRRLENITSIRAFFTDIDGIPHPEQKDEMERKLLAAEIPPSIIIDTRNGFQCYWLAHSGEQLEHAREVNEGLVLAFNGDNNAKDISRVLRTPGFYHLKESPYLVSVRYLSDERYVAAELAAAYPAPTPPPPPKRTREYQIPDDADYLLVHELISYVLPLWGEGSRNRLALAVGAKLYYWGVPQEDAIRAVERICAETGDADVHNRVHAVRATYQSARGGANVSTFDLKGLSRKDLLS